MKTVLTTTALLLLTVASGSAHASCPAVFDHTMRKLHSTEQVNLCEAAAGKPALLVNTASHCGFTPQLKGLEALSQKYASEGLVVIGFASDDFRQAAKDEAEAATICYKNYGVKFLMMAPTSVKGNGANPVFTELANQSTPPKWNFNKYLVDRDGKVVSHFGSSTKPDSEALTTAIEGVL
ncbi:MAG: glutathione peroxidase [Halioglobus sp.]